MNRKTFLNLGVVCLISKILVCTDGTQSAMRALDFALDLAEKYAADVTIINVLETPVIGAPEEPSMTASAGMAGFLKDLRKSHQETLNKATEHAAALKPMVKITTELKEGNPPDQIVTAAAEGNFDLVVVGHGGESRIRELFLGSTSERVAHLAHCAVLIVK
jgi:nucleotide-binding universal stress UspA family protein